MPGIIAWVSGTGAPVGTQPYCVGLRCDMDALALSEPINSIRETYNSVVPNMMHACGHDGHMSILTYTVAAICQPSFLQTLPSNFIVKFFFQPAEEDISGARVMVKQMHVLDETSKYGPHVDEVYGLHLISSLPYGVAQSQRGCVLAASMDIDIKVHGRSGHAGCPQRGIDATLIAANILLSAQTIITRNIPPCSSTVLSFGHFVSGEIRNGIASDALIMGTIRSDNQENAELIYQRLQQICAGASIQYNCQAEVAL
uniref:N-acetyldiaminopimelate deacetylase n=1 Tax=Lygus hesperus TaxID=30085 RepID=A0A0A9XJ20_LYGHE